LQNAMMTEYTHIAKRILDLKEADMKLRERLAQEGKLWDGYNQEMETLHNSNADALDEIINAIGYPTKENVGKEATEAAWLVIQHSISRPKFMKKCARLLEAEASMDKEQSRNLAYLTDRIAVYEERPQLFGTQFDWDQHGQLSPSPYDDILKVNQRRTSIGLNTLEEQTEVLMRRAKDVNERPPDDFEARRQAMQEWKRATGWIQ